MLTTRGPAFANTVQPVGKQVAVGAQQNPPPGQSWSVVLLGKLTPNKNSLYITHCGVTIEHPVDTHVAVSGQQKDEPGHQVSGGLEIKRKFHKS